MADEQGETGEGISLETHPIHLGTGASALSQPAFPRDERAMDWYMAYGARHAADGTDGRLVSLFHFTESWSGWEMHPAGDEVVVCLSGQITLIQQHGDGAERTIALTAGQYAINPPGTWHTADVFEPVSALFITPGEGTQNRPR